MCISGSAGDEGASVELSLGALLMNNNRGGAGHPTAVVLGFSRLSQIHSFIRSVVIHHPIPNSLRHRLFICLSHKATKQLRRKTWVLSARMIYSFS